MALLGERTRGQIKMNIGTHIAAISACEKAYEWQVAMALLDEISKVGIQMDDIVCNAAISECEN